MLTSLCINRFDVGNDTYYPEPYEDRNYSSQITFIWKHKQAGSILSII